MSAPRALAVVALLVLGVLALPLLASVLDGPSTENLVLPLTIVLMAVVGALVWRAVPAPAGDAPASSPTRTALVGAAGGVAAAVVGIVLFFLLLSGFDGA